MIRGTARTISTAIGAIGLLLVACGGETTTGPTGAETSDGSTEPPGAMSAEEVLSGIADMGLSYQERVAYLHEKAAEEGAVLMYGSPDVELQEALASAFMKEYPEINALYVRQRSDDLYERILSESRSGRHLVDVVIANNVIGAAIHNGGLIANHYGVPIPEDYPELFTEDWAAVTFIQPKVITWNTNNLAEADAPTDWDDFLEPEHAGCALDAGPQSFLGVMLQERGYDGTIAWVEAYLENDGYIRRGHSGSTQALAAGEFDCAVYLYANDVESYIQDGAPLAWHAADPTPGHANSAYIYKESAHPHAAALFMNFMLGPVGQQIMADQARLAVHPSVELQFPALAPFIEPGSDLNARLTPMKAVDAVQWSDDILQIQEDYLVPNLVED